MGHWLHANVVRLIWVLQEVAIGQHHRLERLGIAAENRALTVVTVE